MKSWEEVRSWRRETRATLLARRLAVRRQEKERVKARVSELLLHHVPELRAGSIGFCWPMKGEIDLRDLVGECLAHGADAALPVVAERARPLEYWSWRPHSKLQRGVWSIPVPAERRISQPTILLVPLVGFDGDGYRLGYGGGYHDRTLAAAVPRPLAVGVGYELSRLETIHPQWHDIPMDAIATEAGFTWLGDAKRTRTALQGRSDRGSSDSRSCASPPCSMHELSPSMLGYMTRAEVVDLLETLLEGERAGARAVGAMCKQLPPSQRRDALHDIAKDEARYCAMLSRHIARLGGVPSAATGAFYDKVMAVQDEDQRLDLLNRGQGWVVRMLQDALPRIDDDLLHADLAEMLAVHQQNIARCDGVKGKPQASEARSSADHMPAIP